MWKNICAQEYTAETYAWTMTMESRSAGEIVLLHLPPPSLRLRFVFFLACSEKYKAGSSGPGWPNVGISREPPPPDLF